MRNLIPKICLKNIHKPADLWYTHDKHFDSICQVIIKQLSKMSTLHEKTKKNCAYPHLKSQMTAFAQEEEVADSMAKEQVSSILRALQILECFMDNETEWTLKALVDQLGLPTTTVFRQVSTLTDRRYLEQDPVRKSYRVGPRLMLLASSILGQSDLRQVARPELERLSDTVQETINLSVLLEHDIFYLDKVETHRSIVCNTRVGSRAPAYATSCGKIMLADLSEARVDEYCRWMADNACPLTENTITDPERLREELVRARLDGYAMDNGEIEAGLICVAAPVCDMNRRVVAAVSVSGPDYRMQEDQEVMIREVRKTAGNISRLLGWQG